MAIKQKPTTAPADNALKNVSDYRFPEALARAESVRSDLDRTFRGEL
jgi:hypothetical protein